MEEKKIVQQPWGDRTRQKIIKAAVQLFAKNGFSGTSITQIADKAKISRSLIFHHFTNKESLWVAVKLSFGSEPNNQFPVPSADQPLKAYLTELFHGALLFYESHPDLMRILAWQRLEKSKGLDLKVGASDSAKIYVEQIEKYQSREEIDPAFDPWFVVTLLFSVIYTTSAEIFSVLQKEEARKRYVEFCVERMLKALT